MPGRRNIRVTSAKNRCGHVGAASMLNSQRALSISHGSAQTHHTKLSTAFYPSQEFPSLYSYMLHTSHREHGECAHILHFLLGRYCTIKKRLKAGIYIRAVYNKQDAPIWPLENNTHGRRRAVRAAVCVL